MRHGSVILLLTAFLTGMLSAEDGPPALMWTREMPDWIHEIQHIIPATGGGFIAATVPSTSHKPIVRLDEDGNVLWEAGYCGIGFAYWVEELPDGSIVATGYGSDPGNTEYGLWITGVSANGDPLWYRVYEISSSIAEKGLCIEPLPDGGYAVCGQIAPQDSWLLRTDSDGDTLWTRVWDSGDFDRARRVVYCDGGLTVYVSDYGGVPWLLQYNMDGTLQWVQDYSATTYLDYVGGSACLASDGGYAMATAVYSSLVHVDWSGQEEWRQEIIGTSRRLGLSLNPTMDGGYIFSGWGGVFGGPDFMTEPCSPPVDTGLTNDGWLAKLDSLGQTQWVVYNSQGSRSNYFNCARQLPQGGYIVAGQIEDEVHSDWNGYLLRYAPETGIEEGPPTPGEVLSLGSCRPNPCVGSAILSWTSGLSGPSTVEVFDTTGRLRLSQDIGLTPEGGHTTQLDLEGLPSGCYLISIRCGSEQASTRLVKLP